MVDMLSCLFPQLNLLSLTSTIFVSIFGILGKWLDSTVKPMSLGPESKTLVTIMKVCLSLNSISEEKFSCFQCKWNEFL
jgi:hypothetical protein